MAIAQKICTLVSLAPKYLKKSYSHYARQGNDYLRMLNRCVLSADLNVSVVTAVRM